MATTSLTKTNKTAPKKRFSRQQKQEWLAAFLFLSPSLVGLIVFFLVPVIGGFGISFTDWDLLSTPKFVGLENYQTALKSDPLFWLSLKHTLQYALMVILAGVPLSLGLALAVNSPLKGIHVFRTIFFIPVVVSSIAASLVWKWIFQPEMGALNTVLKFFGLPTPMWLGDGKTALISVAIVAIWLGLGYNMVIFLAGLKGIPRHLYEAAALDGAVGFQSFWFITLPLLTPTLFFVLVMSVIGSFQVFGQVYVMTTNAGPGNATLVYVYYLWENAFKWFKMGYASALAYLLFIIILIVTIIQMKFLGGRVNYEVD
jgi:multiple sugar transport system permease protein